MKLFRLVLPVLAGVAMAAGTLTAFARGRAAPASPPAPLGFETDLASVGASPGAENMHADASGRLWISQDSDAGAYVRVFDPATRAYTDYTGITSPNDAQLGPDGNVWWNQDSPFQAAGLARLDLASRTITTWSAPIFSGASLAFDSNNTLWALDWNGSSISSFDPISHTLCNSPLPYGRSSSFLTEHNGALWLGLSDVISPGLARITSTTNAYTIWPLSGSTTFATDGSVAFAPNGVIWFSGAESGTIGRLETGANRVTLFNPPGGYISQQVNYFLSKVWFTGQIGDSGIGTTGYLDPATATGTTPVVVTPTAGTLAPVCLDAGAGLTFTAGISTGVSVLSPMPLTTTVDAQGVAYAPPDGSVPASMVNFGSYLWLTDQGRNKLIELVIPTTIYLPLVRR